MEGNEKSDTTNYCAQCEQQVLPCGKSIEECTKFCLLCNLHCEKPCTNEEGKAKESFLYCNNHFKTSPQRLRIMSDDNV